MIRLTLLLLLASLAACEAAGDGSLAAARDDPPRAKPSRTGGGPNPDPGAPADCALTVRFGSYAMGIDRPTLEAVEALLAADAAVTSVERHPWGREGEVTLCARTGSDGDADRLHRLVADLFPADPRGPLSVTTRTGLAFHAPPRQR